MKNKYTTLVFNISTPEAIATVREFASSDTCTAMSRDHEILRLELIESALEEGEYVKAESYISAVDVTQFSDRLTT